MGGSLYACYPAWLLLSNAGLSVLWVDTAELIHHTPALVTSKTLLWIFSQSGKSAEIISAIDFGRIQKPAALIATVNDLESPLANASQIQIPLKSKTLTLWHKYHRRRGLNQRPFTSQVIASPTELAA